MVQSRGDASIYAPDTDRAIMACRCGEAVFDVFALPAAGRRKIAGDDARSLFGFGGSGR